MQRQRERASAEFWMDVPNKKLTQRERNGPVGTLSQLQKYTSTVLHDNKYEVHWWVTLNFLFIFTTILR